MGEEETDWVESLALVLLFPLTSGTPSAVSRFCREGLLGPWSHPASGMVRRKVGSLGSELWGRGLGRRGPRFPTLRHQIEWHWGGCRFFLLSLNCLPLSVGHTGSEIEGGEGC